MQEKNIFFKYKILNSVSLLYIRKKKNKFFINRKYSVVFLFYIYARKKINFYYLHKVVNDFIYAQKNKLLLIT